MPKSLLQRAMILEPLIKRRSAEKTMKAGSTLCHPLAIPGLFVSHCLCLLPGKVRSRGRWDHRSLVSCFHTCPMGNLAPSCKLCDILGNDVIQSVEPPCTYFVAWAKTYSFLVWGFYWCAQGNLPSINGSRAANSIGGRKVCEWN